VLSRFFANHPQWGCYDSSISHEDVGRAAAAGWKVPNASRIGESMNEFGSDWPRKQRAASIRY
jgi:hypothetical protein